MDEYLFFETVKARCKVTALAILAAAFATSFSFAAQTSAQAKGNWYQDPELKVSFYYSMKFSPAEPAESTTRYLVNWRANSSGSLLASCYLRAIPTDVEETKGREFLLTNTKNFVQSLIEKTKIRASEVSLLEFRPAKADGLQALYIVMDSTIENFDRDIYIRTYSLITFWKNWEIALECGTTVPSVVNGNIPKKKADSIIKNVENEIFNVLRTLHFERS